MAFSPSTWVLEGDKKSDKTAAAAALDLPLPDIADRGLRACLRAAMTGEEAVGCDAGGTAQEKVNEGVLLTETLVDGESWEEEECS